MAGALLSRTPTRRHLRRPPVHDASRPASPPLTDGDVDTKTWAIFGDFTYDITDQFSVSVGGRYTNDKRHATVFRQSYLGGGSPIFGGASRIPFGARDTPTSTATAQRQGVHAAPVGQLTSRTTNHHVYAS